MVVLDEGGRDAGVTDGSGSTVSTLAGNGLALAMVVAGGGLVVAYIESDIALKPILAINVGASAPLIIRTLVAKVPRNPGTSD